MKKNNFIKLVIGVVTVAGIALGLSTCRKNKNTNNEGIETMAATPKRLLKTGLILKSTTEMKISLPGELKPFEEVQIFAKLNSFVKKVNVDRGSEVHKGDVLIELEAPELNAQLAEAYGKLHAQEAKWNAGRQNYLRLYNASKTGGAVSQNDLDQNKAIMVADSAAMASAQSNCQGLEALKSYLTILAPFDGVITSRNIHPGALVGPSGKGSETALLELQETRLLRLVIAIPDYLVAKVSLKDSIQFQVNAYPNHVFHARVIRRAEALNNQIRAELVEADVPNEDNSLKAGMYVNAKINSSENNNDLSVIKSAVLQNTEGNFILKITNGLIRRCPITILNKDDQMVKFIGDGLKVKDSVVLEATNNLKDNMPYN